MMEKEYKYLGKINSPKDLKELSQEEMNPLCAEIRECIIDTVNKNGGHLASNLGAVELSVAIHRVFDAPKDHVIFDVGHQSYTHKILTGRFDRFDTLRAQGGISGFTNRAESEYDCFGAGHSSTSVSAGLGFAEADRLSGSDAYTVVVLGDGAFTGGMIHEALNNCDRNLRLIIILNENEMSISKNIGKFAQSISNLRKKSGYFKAKRATASFVKKIPLIGKGLFTLMYRAKKALKNLMYGSNYFEDMGLYYLGPADGNNYDDVESLLKMAKNAGESVLVHLKTQKGKGYTPAEENPGEYHGVSASGKKSDTNFSLEFGKKLTVMADSDENICAITAAMSYGTGLECFKEAHKSRFFDVGIAEEHAVTFAAGLAANGKKPVVAVYSTFLQRAYDQILHDVALQNLPVVFCIDRAGFNGADGATHHGIFDVAMLSQVKNIKTYTPVSYAGLRASLESALSDNVPSAIRYPSGSECDELVKVFYTDENFADISIKTDFAVADKPKNIIITHGRIAGECLKAEKILKDEGIDVGIVLCEYISPYASLAEEIMKRFDGFSPENIFFVEEEIRSGGFGENLSVALKNKSAFENSAYHIIAAEDAFVKQTADLTYAQASGVDFKSIAEKIREKNAK